MNFIRSLSTPAGILTVGLMLASTAVLQAQQGAGMQNPPGKPPQQQPAGQDRNPPAPDAEIQAAKKVADAPDVPGKLQAAAEFVKKYPKSALMKPVAQRVASKIAEGTEPAQKISFSENYISIFKDTSEADLMTPMLIDCYVKANRGEEAFKVANPFLEKYPGDLTVLTQMAIVGVELIKAKKNQFAQQSEQDGLKAIGIIEAGNKPATLTDAQWKDYKEKWLPQLYQSIGIVSFVSGRADEAKGRIQKAITLNPADPFNYLLLGSLANAEYQKLAEKYKGMAPGPAQDETLKQAHEKMDLVIDYWAHAAALSEDNVAYKPLHDSVMPDLGSYYKYRHKSTDGLQQLIDKYKAPAAAH